MESHGNVNMVMEDPLVSRQEYGDEKGSGVSLRDTKNEVGREGVTHLIVLRTFVFGLLRTEKNFLRGWLIATVELRRRGLGWKREELEFVSRRGAGEDAGCICYDYVEQHYCV